MSIFKKVTGAILIATGVIGLVACGGGNDGKAEVAVSGSSPFAKCFDIKANEDWALKWYAKLDPETKETEFVKKYMDEKSSKNIQARTSHRVAGEAHSLACVIDKMSVLAEAGAKEATEAIKKNPNLKPEEIEKIEYAHTNVVLNEFKANPEVWTRFNGSNASIAGLVIWLNNVENTNKNEHYKITLDGCKSTLAAIAVGNLNYYNAAYGLSPVTIQDVIKHSSITELCYNYKNTIDDGYYDPSIVGQDGYNALLQTGAKD